MDRRYVSALAEELAQLTCRHLPWTDQRVIALELGVGECDLASDDMVRAEPSIRHVRCPATSSHGCTSGSTGIDATACTDQAQLRGYVNRLHCA
jgi:hypothetical protein